MMDRKTFFSIFTVAVSVLTPLALTSCSEDIQTEEHTEKGTETEVRQVVFSSYDDGTRTSIDTGRKFYWETGDNIWVNNGGTYIQSMSNDITEKTYKANFIFNAALNNPAGYEVLYTGQNSPEASLATADALHVTIAANQTQSAWNDATHLGTSGDCGTDMAEKSGNNYRFKLEHKAAYLIIYPYISATYIRDYTLQKIEITSDNTIAGTYPFNMSGLDTDNVTNTSNTITFTPGTTFNLGKAAENHIFVVIQPGTHSLSLKYTYKNEANEEFTTTKTLTADRTFSVNGVTVIKHKLMPFAFFFENTYYLWDAQDWLWHGVNDYPTTNGATRYWGYPTTATSGDSRLYNTTLSADYASNSLTNYSAKGMPCYNAMTWYLRGGIYKDATIEWTMTSIAQNTTREITGGFWVKKWDHIAGKPANSTILSCPSASGTTSVTMTIGKPDKSIIDQYFFLPMLGSYGLPALGATQDNFYFVGLGSAGSYASSTPVGGANYRTAMWGLDLGSSNDANAAAMYYNTYRGSRLGGWVAGTRPDGTAWFQ